MELQRRRGRRWRGAGKGVAMTLFFFSFAKLHLDFPHVVRLPENFACTMDYLDIGGEHHSGTFSFFSVSPLSFPCNMGAG